MTTPDIDTRGKSEEAPAHVPKHLIRNYDFAAGKEVLLFPPCAVEGFRKSLPIFYSTLYGGFWVLSSYDDVRAAFKDHETFQMDIYIPRFSNHRFIPLHNSPPLHTYYKKVEAPLFSPGRIASLARDIRQIMRDRLNEMSSLDEFDLVSEFSLISPTMIFCATFG